VVLEAVVLAPAVLEDLPVPLDGGVVLGAVAPEGAEVVGAVVPDGAGVFGAVVLEGGDGVGPRVVVGRPVVVTCPVATDFGVVPPPQPARTRANAAGTANAARLLTAGRRPELFGSRSVGTGRKGD
jgi:hypothetical protein